MVVPWAGVDRCPRHLELGRRGQWCALESGTAEAADKAAGAWGRWRSGVRTGVLGWDGAVLGAEVETGREGGGGSAEAWHGGA